MSAHVLFIRNARPKISQYVESIPLPSKSNDVTGTGRWMVTIARLRGPGGFSG
jgi:hypothetical protein